MLLSQIYQGFRSLILYPALYSVLALQSAWTGWKLRGKPTNVFLDTAHDGQPILLVALYQKGVLRPDILRLAETAKAQGMYVVGVNTLKLQEPEALQGLFDCYIERPNFGRDFGSYKTGFLHLFANGAAAKCPRLIMCNDSVFYTRKNLAAFLAQMRETDIEVLGSTENFEIEHHLGSFWISVSNRIVNDQRFRDYWRRYRLTDVRPRVIEKGEIRLSEVLRKCTSTQDDYASMFNVHRYTEALSESDEAIDFALWNMRRSDVFLWPKFEPSKIEEFLENGLIVPIHDRERGSDMNLDTDLTELQRKSVIYDYATLRAFLLRNVPNPGKKEAEIVRNAVVSELTRVFVSGSQIHGSSSILLWLGLPIVKLDGLYRGAFNNYDVRNICDFVGVDDASEVRRLLMARPFGGETMYGWKRAAFSFGLI